MKETIVTVKNEDVSDPDDQAINALVAMLKVLKDLRPEQREHVLTTASAHFNLAPKDKPSRPGQPWPPSPRGIGAK